MLTIYEMNPEGYAYDPMKDSEKVFRGSTLEEILKDVMEYFSKEYEDEPETVDVILKQAKKAYRGKVNEYVYFNGNGRIEDNYFLTYDKAYEHESTTYMDCWYEMNKINLVDKFIEKLESVDLEEMVIDFIVNNFNGCRKYNLELIGYERGRSFWSTIEINDYDVNEIYDELADNFLDQVYTGEHLFGQYATFYNNFIEKLEKVIESKKHEIYEEFCVNYLEGDYFFCCFDEDVQEYITDFTATIEGKVDWEDMKEYVE